MSTTVHTTCLADYQPSAWSIPRIELSFELDAESSEVHALMHCERVGEAGQALVLQGECLELLRIAIDDVPLDAREFSLSDTGLTLHNPPARFRALS